MLISDRCHWPATNQRLAFVFSFWTKFESDKCWVSPTRNICVGKLVYGESVHKFREDEEDSDEEIEIEEPKIPNSEAFAAVEFLKKFYLQRDNSSANLLALDRMKRELENQMTYSQPTLESFIQK